MKKLLVAGVIVLSLFIASVFQIGAWADDPPELEPGWNLISAPCTVSIAAIMEKTGIKDILAYEWNGEGYTQVDTLRRGTGYAVNTNSAIGVAGLCAGPDDTQPLSIPFLSGWNLMGNPYHRALLFTEALGDKADQIADLIFEYKGGRYRPMLKTDKITVWSAVWIYAFNPITLYYDFNCDPMAVELVSPESATLEIGGAATLKAVCTIEGNNGAAHDVTAQSNWEISDPAVFAATETPGVFTAVKDGVCAVTARFDRFAAVPVVLTVLPPAPVLESLTLSVSKAALAVGETASLSAAGIYSDGSTRDLTGSAVFNSSNPEAGVIDGAALIAVAEGRTDVTAAAEGFTSNSVRVTVSGAPQYSQLGISIYPATIQIHEYAVLQAYAYLTTGGAVNVTDQVVWNFDGEAGRIDSNRVFYPSRLGRVEFTAAFAGMTSNAAEISVVEKQLIWLGLHPVEGGPLKPLPCPDEYYYSCYNNHYIELGREGRFHVTAAYNNYDWGMNVTARIEKWQVLDESVLTVDGGKVTPLKTGLTGVRAYMDGVWSETAWVRVVDGGTGSFLILEYSHRDTIVKQGESIGMNATYYTRASAGGVAPYYVYDYYVEDGIFNARGVTDVADWLISNSQIGSFDRNEALFTGARPGTTNISAGYGGLRSNSVELEVWSPADMSYCNPEKPNEASWTDNITIAQLSTDCDRYAGASPVTVSFSALLSDYYHVLDVCLDLFIYDSDQQLVKTFRNQNCTPEPLMRRAVVGFKPVFEYTAQWDRKDDAGQPVPPGVYTAVARFYVLYCPVLKVNFTIE